MTLYNIINSIQGIALTQPNVRTADNGSIYDKLDNNPAIQYGVVFLSQTNHREDEQFDYYGFNIFYIDRLDDTMENNRLQIQSIGKEVLSNTIRTFCNTYDVDMPTLRYQPFTQKFDDECAGVYVSLELEIMKDYICDETYDEPVPVPPLVIRNQTKSIDVIENGHYTVGYDAGYTGLEKVNININVPQHDGEFLYNFDYEELDYDFANEYFERHAPEIAVGGCSAVRSGNFVGRHLDWQYDWEAMAFIRTPHNMGVAGGLPSFTIAQMESGLTEEQKKILPFFLQDGINEHGLFAEINVVPAAGNTQTPGDERICSLMLVRYILDHYDSVDAAIEGLSDKQIFFPTTLTDMGYESHYMIADSAKTAVLEIIDNALVVVEDNVSTNYHLYGVSANTDGTVNTPETAISGRFASDNGIEEYGTGLERYNALKTARIGSKQDMENALKSVLFSKAYTEPWYSEFVGVGEDDITVDTPANDPAFVARIQKYQEIFANRSRETALTWNTCHASIYDLENRILYLKIQEKNAENIYRWFELRSGGTYEEGYASGYTDGHADGYTEGVEEGYEQGESGQKAKLVSTAITANGTYRKEDGYNEVSVNVPQTILQSTAFTENGSYVMEDGYAWSEVDVNVPTANLQYLKTTLDEIQGEIYPEAGYDGLSSVMYDANGVYTLGYNSGVIIGHENGVAEQKAKLVATAITANGTYTREDGFNSVTVNVPTGETLTWADMDAEAFYMDTDGNIKPKHASFVRASVVEVRNFPDYCTDVENCTNLTACTIGNKCGLIIKDTFQNCNNLTAIDIPASVRNIQDEAFQYSGIVDITAHGHAAYIYNAGSSQSFQDMSPTGVLHYPEGLDYSTWLTALGTGWTGETYNRDNLIFYKTKSHSDSMLKGVPTGTVGSGSEYYKYLLISFPVSYNETGILHSDGVEDDIVHLYSEWYDLDYNDSGGFVDSDVTEIDLPKTLASVGMRCFENCTYLNTIYVRSSVAPTIGTNCFNGISTTGTLHYPSGSDYSTWINALPSGWTAIADL